MTNILTTMEIIEVMDRMEVAGAEFNTVEGYMVNEYGIDWDRNEVTMEIYKVLKAGMYKDKVTGNWYSK